MHGAAPQDSNAGAGAQKSAEQTQEGVLDGKTFFIKKQIDFDFRRAYCNRFHS